ncbi:MFS transporter [Halonotius roseus]|uniref:MFS transporter n=1 Tax=Halonotius roseus TaxID=2511997 RepID=A0A544QLT8_9EURY|nr:MFS transporter [Halonotius roseus]TQQ79576.1 MFS transporter [Halonotius roseus]
MALRGLRGDGRGWTLLAIASGWVFVLGGRFLVPAVLPQVKNTFAVSDVGAGVAITIIWATYGLMQTPAGLLVDRIGERKLLAGSAVLTATSVVVIGAAPAFAAFIVGCAGFGLATGLYGPARGTALSRAFPDHDGAAIGATLAAGSVGSAVLPLAAGSLVGEISWRLLVGGLAVPLVALGVVIWATVPSFDNGDGATPDDGTSTKLPVGDVLAAIRTRQVAVALTALTLMTFVFQGVSAFYVTYLTSVSDFAQSTAAAMFSLVFVGGAVAQVAAGGLADAVGDRPVLVAVSAATIPVLVAIPMLDSVIGVAAASLLLGIRLGVPAVSNAYIIAILPESVTGAAWGVLRTTSFMLAATGSTVVGVMADNDLFDEAFFLLAGLTALGTLLYTRLPDR